MYCGYHYSDGYIGGTYVISYIDVVADPACSGTRARRYFHFAEAGDYLDYIGFEPDVGARSWRCGVLQYYYTAGLGWVYQLGYVNYWQDSTSCGFQADQNAKFVKSGYTDVWRYAQW